MENTTKRKRLVWQGESDIVQVSDQSQAMELLQGIGTTRRGAEIMADKMVFRVIKLTGVDTRAANILKQTLLSKGADCAVSAATVNLAAETTDVLVFATVAQLKLCIDRLKEQPWGLVDVAGRLETLL